MRREGVERLGDRKDKGRGRRTGERREKEISGREGYKGGENEKDESGGG